MAGIDMAVRRIFAWPLLLVGVSLVSLGGALIRGGAWCVDVDTKDM